MLVREDALAREPQGEIFVAGLGSERDGREPKCALRCGQRQMVGDLLNRVFDGSASNLLMHALATKKGTSAEELSQIRDILDEFERGAR